jgi:hypothetical protein
MNYNLELSQSSNEANDEFKWTQVDEQTKKIA